MIIAALIFTVSGLFYATAPPEGLSTDQLEIIMTPTQSGLLMSDLGGGHQSGTADPQLWNLFLRPQGAFILLLLATHVAVLWRAARNWTEVELPVASAARKSASPNPSLSTWFSNSVEGIRQGFGGVFHAQAKNAQFVVAMLLSALWPGVAMNGYDVLGTVLAMVAMTFALAAAIRGVRTDTEARHTISVGIFAGWTVVVGFAALASLMITRMGVDTNIAIMACVALATICVILSQILTGGVPSIIITVMLVLVVIAAATMQTDPTQATAAVLGVAAMGVVLVRESS
ncbi:hypothetical protein [Paracoccus pacificus]|uniref:Uncharacterized protein n=1 Tax=Paracoccus pacificus TaxID=1463598 RepID=A0ABW4R9F2_9RHOB